MKRTCYACRKPGDVGAMMVNSSNPTGETVILCERCTDLALALVVAARCQTEAA